MNEYRLAFFGKIHQITDIISVRPMIFGMRNFAFGIVVILENAAKAARANP